MDGDKGSEVQEVAVEARGMATVIGTVGAPPAPKSAPKKRSRGRPKGTPNRVGRAAKEEIADAHPEQHLIRVMKGQKFMRSPEQGGKRRVACYPTLAESTGAAYKLLAKIVADLKSFELGGTPDGVPVAVTANELPSNKEVARRLLGIFNNADREILAEAEEARGGPAVAPVAATPALAFPQNGPDGVGHTHIPGYSGAPDGPEGDGGPAEDEDVVLPIPVEFGHMIDRGGQAAIQCQGADDRTGLVSYALLDHVGRRIRYFSDGKDGFERAVAICEQKFGKPKCRYVRPPA